jgi:hypothetical protein
MNDMHLSSPDEQRGDEFLNKAKRIVAEYYGNHEPGATIYIVWFAKTLKNWKALLSTSRPDGHYFEITHNGDKNETYVDVYIKDDNYIYEIYEEESK